MGTFVFHRRSYYDAHPRGYDCYCFLICVCRRAPIIRFSPLEFSKWTNRDPLDDSSLHHHSKLVIAPKKYHFIDTAPINSQQVLAPANRCASASFDKQMRYDNTLFVRRSTYKLPWNQIITIAFDIIVHLTSAFASFFSSIKRRALEIRLSKCYSAHAELPILKKK